MAYPAQFHRLVMIGDLYGDTFNTTMAIIPVTGTAPMVTQPLVDAVATKVALWFNDNLSSAAPRGCGFTDEAVLTSVKLNRIGTDGRYVDADAMESAPAGGPYVGYSASHPPAQLSLAATLRGSNPRALAGKGRMFLPTAGFLSSVGTDGRITATQAEQYAYGVRQLIIDVVSAYTTLGILNCAVGIASNTRAGAFQPVHDVSVGRTVDTIRSRRNKIPEDPYTLAI